MSRSHNFDFWLSQRHRRTDFCFEVAKIGSVAIITKKDRAESNTNYAQAVSLLSPAVMIV